MTAPPRLGDIEADDLFVYDRTHVVIEDGRARVVTMREPGDEPPEVWFADEEQVTVGGLLAELSPQMSREERMSAAALERTLRLEMQRLARQTMNAMRWGRGEVPGPRWEILGMLELERLHGGALRVWREGKDGARGEWRTRYRRKCGKSGCVACRGMR